MDFEGWWVPVEPQGWVWARAQCFSCEEVHCFRRLSVEGVERIFCLPCADDFERRLPTRIVEGRAMDYAGMILTEGGMAAFKKALGSWEK